MFVVNNIEFNQTELLKRAAAYCNHQDIPEWERDFYSFINDWFSDSDTLEVNTSGSTGEPKRIQFSKKQFEVSANRSVTYFGLNPESNILLCLPVKYIAGMMMVVRAITSKSNLIVINPQEVKSYNLSVKIDFAAMVPLQANYLLSNESLKSNIKQLIIGGSGVNQVLQYNLLEGFPGKVWETYGMTETLTHVALRPLENDFFEALPNIRFNIDHRQCLVIDDPLIQKKPLITNDIVNLISESRFKYLGRHDQVINSGGIKIHPEQLVQVLSKVLKIQFIIIGVPDPLLGQTLAIVVENGSINESELIDSFQMLSKYEIPRKIIWLDKIPFLPTGKPDILKIKELIA